MNDAKAFVDTNIIAYLYSRTDEQKRSRAYSALTQYDRQISTQVLNEFSHVCTKKWKLAKEKTQNLIR
jgi:predicted nucleic acid-binding protein